MLPLKRDVGRGQNCGFSGLKLPCTTQHQGVALADHGMCAAGGVFVARRVGAERRVAAGRVVVARGVGVERIPRRWPYCCRPWCWRRAPRCRWPCCRYPWCWRRAPRSRWPCFRFYLGRLGRCLSCIRPTCCICLLCNSSVCCWCRCSISCLSA